MKAEWERVGDEFHFRWTAFGLGMSFDHLEDRRSGLHAEVRVVSILPDAAGQVYWDSISLSAGKERISFSNHLAKRLKGVDAEAIASIFEEASGIVGKEYRQPDPAICLADMPRPTAQLYLVKKFLPSKVITIMFGDGGAMKSLLALAIAMSVQIGREIVPGLRPLQQGSVLYADWETCWEDQRERMEAICKGHSIGVLPPIHYQRMRGKLEDAMPELRRQLDRVKATLLVVDSLGFACAADLKAPEVALGAMAGLAGLEITTLAIGHEAKEDSLTKKKASVFGSVFFQNAARSLWHCRRADDDGTGLVPVAMYHRKANRSRLHDPIGLCVEIENDGEDALEMVSIRPYDISKNESLKGSVTASYLLRGALARANGTLKTTAALAAETGLEGDRCGVELGRLRDKGIVVQLGGGPGRGNTSQWALRARDQA